MPKATRILSPFHNLPVGQIVDQLGGVKAAIADLQTREKALRDELLSRSVSQAEGAQFGAVVSQSVRWDLGHQGGQSRDGRGLVRPALPADPGDDRFRRAARRRRGRQCETRGLREGDTMERLSRRKILGAAGAFAGGSALAGAAAASGAIAPVPAAGADGDAMALSLFRQWIAAGQDYERQAAADPDRDEYPASAVMWDLEDRIFEIQGTAAALAIKTHFVIRQAHASWGPEPFLRIREAFNDDRDWEIEVAVGMLREAARFVPEIGELAAPVLHPDAALIDAEIEVQWCREQLAKPFRVALDRDDEFARWLRDNDTRHHDETRALLAKMLDRIAGTEAKTARGAAIKAKHAIGAEGLA